MAEKNFKITGGLALGDYALTANGLSLLWDSNALATQAYVTNAVSAATVNTNAIAESLASSTLYVNSGDNLNVNVNAFVSDLDGSGLYVTGNTLNVNTNAFASNFTQLNRGTIYTDSGRFDVNVNAIAGTGLVGGYSSLSVNTNAIAESLASSTLYVNSGDNLNVNVNAFVNDLDGSGLYVTGNQLAVNTNAIATRDYVDSVAQGLDVKASVRTATTENIENLNTAPLVIDGITLNNGDRVLVKNQTLTSQNGIYFVDGIGASNLTLTRAIDANDPLTDLTTGSFTFVEVGTANAGKGFVALVTDVGMGSPSISWSQFSEAGTLTAGSNIYLSSGSINVNVNSLVGDLDGSGLYVTGNQLAINTNAIVGNLDGLGLYVDGITLAVNTNALAGTGLVSSSGTLALDQYAAGVRYDGTSGSTAGKYVRTDTYYGFTSTSNTYIEIGDPLSNNTAFTYDIVMRNTYGHTRKSTVSGFINSGTVEYTEYAIVDSATPLTSPDVKVESNGFGGYQLYVKATFIGMDQISTVASAVIMN